MDEKPNDEILEYEKPEPFLRKPSSYTGKPRVKKESGEILTNHRKTRRKEKEGDKGQRDR